MRRTPCSRRAMPPLSAAEAAPVAFGRMGARTEDSGTDVVLIPA